MNLYYVESEALDAQGDPILAGCYNAEGLIDLQRMVYADFDNFPDEVVKVYRIYVQPHIVGRLEMRKMAEFRLPRVAVMPGEAEA